jgi:hypothetical protein
LARILSSSSRSYRVNPSPTGIRPSATISSNLVTPTPRYSAAWTRERPRRARQADRIPSHRAASAFRGGKSCRSRKFKIDPIEPRADARPSLTGRLARRLSIAGELLAHRGHNVNIVIIAIITRRAGQRGCIKDLHRPGEPVWVDGGGRKPGRVRQPCLSKPTTCHVPSTVSSVPEADL